MDRRSLKMYMYYDYRELTSMSFLRIGHALSTSGTTRSTFNVQYDEQSPTAYIAM